MATAKPAVAADFVEGDPYIVDVTIIEGRYRQVRRMWEHLSGNRVIRLVRRSFGPLSLGDLAVGESRELVAAEVDALRQHIVSSMNAGVSEEIGIVKGEQCGEPTKDSQQVASEGLADSSEQRIARRKRPAASEMFSTEKADT
jgi:hypothetical protein